MEELKRAQEMRTDEFSSHELRESQATLQELTSQIVGAARKSELYERFLSIPKEKWTFVDKNVDAQKVSHGVVCGGRQRSMHEARKEQQNNEDARNMQVQGGW